MQDLFFDAVKQNDIETVKLLLSDPHVNPQLNDNWAIRWSSVYGRLEIVKLLLFDGRANPGALNNESIIVASANGYTEVVRLLLQDKRVDPSANNNSAIQWASQNGHTEVVRLLLSDPRVDPSVKDNIAIRFASAYDHLDVVKLLLQDPRVDFDAIHEKMKHQLISINEEKNKLKTRLVSGYRSLEKSSPQVLIEKSQKSQIPKPLIKKIVYQSEYEELCSTIPGNYPPVKLLALAELLKIQYNQNTSYAELCGKVKLAILKIT